MQNSGQTKLGATLAAVLFLGALEAAYFLPAGSPGQRLAGLAWLVTAVGMLGAAGVLGLAPLFQRSLWSHPSRGWYVTATLLPLLLLYFGITGTVWTPFFPEGVAQNVVGADLFRHDPAHGVYQAAYFGRYIARQYVLASLPTLVFGPSFVALRLGSSLVFVTGFLAFLSSLARYLNSRQIDGWFWSAWAGMMASLGYYPLMVARTFEQTTMPIGATFLLGAALIEFALRPGSLRAVGVAWALGFLTCGYTPALASWTLGAVLILYLGFRPPESHRLLLLALVSGSAALLVAELVLLQAGEMPQSLAIGPGLSSAGWIGRYASGLIAVFGSRVSAVPFPLGLAAGAVLFAAVRRRDLPVVAVFLWCLGVIVVSLSLVGSWFDVPANAVHRTMVILPVLAGGVVWYGQQHAAGAMAAPLLRRLAIVSMAYMIITALTIPLRTRWRTYEERPMNDFDEAGLRLSCLAHDAGRPDLRELTVVYPLNLNLFDLEAGTRYFFPEATVIQDAAPVPGPGEYTLAYNDRPRAADYRSRAKRTLDYIALQARPETPADRAFRQRIDRAHGLVATYGSGNRDIAGRTLPALPLATREMCLALWVKWKGRPGSQHLLNLGIPVAGSTNLTLVHGTDDGHLQLGLDSALPPNLAEHAEVNTPLLTPGRWTLLTVQLTRTELSLWIGAAEAGRAAVDFADPNLLRSNHQSVGLATAGGRDFQGEIRTLRVYNRPLRADEIAQLAAETPP